MQLAADSLLAPERLASRRVLLPDGSVRPATVSLQEGQIVAITDELATDALDLGGLLLAPGLVDLHGDAFERQLMPRPGVMIDPVLALQDTDRQLVANGITTAFHGVTWSWEPGLRSVATGRRLIATLERARDRLAAEHRLHIRFETHNLDGLDELVGLVRSRRVDLVAFNDHTPAMARAAGEATGNLGIAYRAMVARDAFNALAKAALARAPDVPEALARLAAECRAAGLPMLSHDDATPEQRAAFRALGASLCEFPKNLATAEAAKAAGEPVVMGAPNILRGRSHLGWLSARDAVAAGLCDVLASDYYYPALLQAPFRLAAEAVLPLPNAWDLVAGGPARAAGLDDRGTIAVGARADLVAIADDHDLPPRIRLTWRAGRLVYFQGCDAG